MALTGLSGVLMFSTTRGEAEEKSYYAFCDFFIVGMVISFTGLVGTGLITKGL